LVDIIDIFIGLFLICAGDSIKLDHNTNTVQKNTESTLEACREVGLEV